MFWKLKQKKSKQKKQNKKIHVIRVTKKIISREIANRKT